MSEKFQTVSFDLYSSVMGITGLGLVWRAAAKTYDVSALPGEVFLATGLAVFLVLTGIQLLRLVFCRQRQLVIAGFFTTAVSHTRRARFMVTQQKASALAIGNTQALRGHLSSQPPVNNVLNDFESVDFI